MQREFVQKASYYKTAKIRGHIFTHNGENDLEEGTIVGVRFLNTEYSSFYRTEVAIFEVTLQGGKIWGNLNEQALTNFVL